jgi:hypothetical protein
MTKNLDKTLWCSSRYIGYVVFTKYGDTIFCEVPSHISLTPNKCYQLREFGNKDFIQRYIDNDFGYSHDCDSVFYEYSPEMLTKMHGPTERIVADIKQIHASNAYVYVINNVAYPSQFPVQWALTPVIETDLGNDDQVHTTICGPGTSPNHCNNCNLAGSYRGIFLGYCANCALYSYNFERGFGFIDNGEESEPAPADWEYVMQSKYPCSSSFDPEFDEWMYDDECEYMVRKIYKSAQDSYLKDVDITTLGYGLSSPDNICLQGGTPPTGPDICDNQEDMDPVREDEVDTKEPNWSQWPSNRYPRRAYGVPTFRYREVLSAHQTDTLTPDFIREKMEILFANNNISVSDNNYSFPIGPREPWDHYRLEKRPTCWFGWNAMLPSTDPDEEEVDLAIRLYVSHVHTEEAPAELVVECNNAMGRSTAYWSLMETMKAWILGETENPVIPTTATPYMQHPMPFDDDDDDDDETPEEPAAYQSQDESTNIFMASSLL